MIGQHARLVLTGGAVALAGVVAHLGTPARVMFVAIGALFAIVGADPAVQRLACWWDDRAPKQVKVVSRSPFQQPLALEAFDAVRNTERAADGWRMIHVMQHGTWSNPQCPWCTLHNERNT